MMEMILDRRLAPCLLMSKCIARSAACTREHLSGCGLLADYRKSRLPVPFCISSVDCEYRDICTSEFVNKFGCAQIDEAEARRMSVTSILVGKIKKDGGWCLEGPWFDALRRLAGGDGQFDATQKAAQMSIIAKKFGVRFGNRTSYISLSDDFLNRHEQE